MTPVAGYPVHRVATFRRWSNRHGARFTDWSAACGASGQTSGHGRFATAGQARRAELCSACFPGRTWGGYFPEPIEQESDG